ncbi:endonuclease/exonuclease/phosphatase family protein [Variovorax ginsengisoli]|uniref:endonuclease/exonuclease/phosphatase family protein n=1 Tax=Variovorax ginsengisoli TaxID=363844 RepID=UPI003454F06A
MDELQQLSPTGSTRFCQLQRRDSRGRPWMTRATGLASTWPNAGGWLSLLPLDHVLATPAWTTLGSTTGPDLGSDHRPVIVRLRLKKLAD